MKIIPQDIRICLLEYECIKKHHRLVAVCLSRQKELDADPKAIQRMQFVKRLKNTDGVNVDSTQSMFSSTILEKIKEKGMTFFQGSAAVL